MCRYPWKRGLVLTAVSYASPPYSAQSAGPCGDHALTHWFPPNFITFLLSWAVMPAARSSSVGGLKNFRMGLEVEAWMSSLFWLPPSPPCPYSPPHVLKRSLRSVSVLTQSSLCCTDTVVAVTAWRDMTSARQSTKPSEAWPFRHKAQHCDVTHRHVRMYNPDREQSYVSIDCKLTVSVCRTSEGLLLTSDIKLSSLRLGYVLWEVSSSFLFSFVVLTPQILQSSYW